MARLDFDFHASPSRTRGVVLLLVGLAALTWAGANWRAAQATVDGLALQIVALEQDRPAKPSRPASSAETTALASQREIAAQLRYSWQPAFGAVAGAISPRVALLALDASQAKAQLKLVAEARRLADAVGFIDALLQQPGVRRAELLQHELQTGDPQQPVRFNVLVELRPVEVAP